MKRRSERERARSAGHIEPNIAAPKVADRPESPRAIEKQSAAAPDARRPIESGKRGGIMSTSGPSEQQGAALPRSVTNSLEQVREILVGAQHREFARRLARTDVRIAEQAEELRSETRRRLDALEGYVRKEFEAAATSLESQRTAQLEALNNVSREWRNALGLLEQRMKKLEERVAWIQSDVRQQILDQANSFIDEVRRTREALASVVERELGAERGEARTLEAPERAALGEGTPEARERPKEAA
jgi:hypothetical protein